MLVNRWLSFWKRIDAKGDPIKAYTRLSGFYSEARRAYHNLYHIAHCLDEFEQARYLAEHPDVVEMALWYHDIKDNPKESVVFACEDAKRFGFPDVFAEGVSRLIIATEHETVPKETDARIVTDIDLSILGSPPEEFYEYERKIREEYAQVPKEQFKARRATILRKFLDRKHIYSTGLFRKKYEFQARINLEDSIARLKA